MNIKYEEIKKRLNQVFKEVFDDDDLQIFDEMTANDLEEWDSLMHITLVVSTEKEFGLLLNEKEIGQLDDVGIMIHLLMDRATK